MHRLLLMSIDFEQLLDAAVPPQVFRVIQSQQRKQASGNVFNT
jgi:hypothetical protein